MTGSLLLLLSTALFHLRDPCDLVPCYGCRSNNHQLDFLVGLWNQIKIAG